MKWKKLTFVDIYLHKIKNDYGQIINYFKLSNEDIEAVSKNKTNIRIERD